MYRHAGCWPCLRPAMRRNPDLCKRPRAQDLTGLQERRRNIRARAPRRSSAAGHYVAAERRRPRPPRRSSAAGHQVAAECRRPRPAAGLQAWGQRCCGERVSHAAGGRSRPREEREAKRTHKTPGPRPPPGAPRACRARGAGSAAWPCEHLASRGPARPSAPERAVLTRPAGRSASRACGRSAAQGGPRGSAVQGRRGESDAAGRSRPAAGRVPGAQGPPGADSQGPGASAALRARCPATRRCHAPPRGSQELRPAEGTIVLYSFNRNATLLTLSFYQWAPKRKQQVPLSSENRLLFSWEPFAGGVGLLALNSSPVASGLPAFSAPTSGLSPRLQSLCKAVAQGV